MAGDPELLARVLRGATAELLKSEAAEEGHALLAAAQAHAQQAADCLDHVQQALKQLADAAPESEEHAYWELLLLRQRARRAGGGGGGGGGGVLGAPALPSDGRSRVRSAAGALVAPGRAKRRRTNPTERRPPRGAAAGGGGGGGGGGGVSAVVGGGGAGEDFFAREARNPEQFLRVYRLPVAEVARVHDLLREHLHSARAVSKYGERAPQQQPAAAGAHLLGGARRIERSDRPYGLSSQSRLLLFLKQLVEPLAVLSELSAEVGISESVVSADFYHILDGAASALRSAVMWPSAAQRERLCAATPAVDGFRIVGAVDLTFTPVSRPRDPGQAENFNPAHKKGTPSLRHLIVVDWRGEIILAAAGYPGAFDEKQVLESAIRDGAPLALSEGERLLGDTAFAGLPAFVVAQTRRPANAAISLPAQSAAAAAAGGAAPAAASGGASAEEAKARNALIQRWRVHVEYVVAQLKELFPILSERLRKNRACGSDVFLLCCELYNLRCRALRQWPRTSPDRAQREPWEAEQLDEAFRWRAPFKQNAQCALEEEPWI